MKTVPKITLDTNCIINLLDSSVLPATLTDLLQEIIRYGLQNKADIAITTRVESDLQNDKNENRKYQMMRQLNILPVIGSVMRLDVSRLDSGDVLGGGEITTLWDELQKIVFPGLSEHDHRYTNKRNDIDHLVGHVINKRDIFVTDDKGILNKKTPLYSSPGLVVMSPQECLDYLIKIDLEGERKDLWSEKFRKGYHSPNLSGRIAFDFSNNDGKYVIGNGYFLFETVWSGCGPSSVYAYNDPDSIDVIAVAKDVSNINEIKNAEIYDCSSRCREVKEGQMLILKNINKIYAVVRVLRVDREEDKKGLEFEYVIQADGSACFSDVKP